MSKITILMSCATLCACAGQQNMQSLAGHSAAVVNDYRRELKAFADGQTALNADNDRRIQNFAENREMTEARVRQRVLALDVAGDKPALDAFRLFTATSASDVVAQSPLLRPRAARTPAPALVLDTAAIERLTRQLTELRRPPSFWDQVQRAIAFRSELRAAYAASLGQANQATSEADTEGDVAQNTVTGGQGNGQ